MPLRSVDFEGSTLSDLLAIRSQQEREHEAIVAARIDLAFKEWKATGSDNLDLLKVFLRGHLS